MVKHGQRSMMDLDQELSGVFGDRAEFERSRLDQKFDSFSGVRPAFDKTGWRS